MRINHRPPGTDRCPGPHPAEPGWKDLRDNVCRRCWAQLTRETQYRLKLSGGSGRIQPIVRFTQLRDQLKAAVPLNEIEVSP